MLRSELVGLLAKRRDNDVVVDVDGIRVPIVAATYCHTADQIVLDLDREQLEIALAVRRDPDPAEEVAGA